MVEVVQIAINGAISGAIAVVVWFYLKDRFTDISKDFGIVSKKLEETNKELKKIDKELENHKLHVAEEYVSKKEHEKDLNRIMEYIREGFKGLHRRFDKFEEYVRKELDGKEDKK